MLYTGHFSFHQEARGAKSEHWYGYFTLVAEAPDVKAAVAIFSRLIGRLARTQDLFDDVHEIYLDACIELPSVPRGGILTHVSLREGEDTGGISASLLGNRNRALVSYGWGDNDDRDADAPDERAVVPFVVLSKKPKAASIHKVIQQATAAAIRSVAEPWSHVESEHATTDGSERDPERGPQDERMVAGERVQTFVDKVFGGRAVSVVRAQGDHVLHYPLGRVSDRETPGSVLGPELAKSVRPRAREASTPAVVKGVWRNDRNGFVTDQITALTEDDAIGQLVLAFKKLHPESGSEKVRTQSSPTRRPTSGSKRRRRT